MHWLKRFAWFRTGVLCALCVLILSACGGSNATSQPAINGTSAMAAKQVLTFPNVGTTDLATLDPVQAQDENTQIAISMLYSGLVRTDKDLNIVPDQATWHVSPDNKTYTFTLRSDIKFADGTPLTASAYVYAWSRALQPSVAAPDAETLLGNVLGAADVIGGKTKTLGGVKALSNYTLQVSLAHPVPYFLAALTNPLFVPLNQKVVEQFGTREWSGAVVGSGIGTGPFLLKQWERNVKMVFVPNPYYYGAKLHLTEVNMFFVNDAETAFKTYRASQGDFIWGLAPNDQALVKKMPGFTRVPLLETSTLFFDTTQPPFDNLSVRQAFAYATDRNTLAQVVLNDTAVAAKTILPPGMPGYQSTYKGLGFDKKEAKQLLQTVYPDLKDMPPVTFAYPSSQLSQNEVSELQQMWQSALGIQITMRAVEATAYDDEIGRNQVQFGFMRWQADFPDPYDCLALNLLSTSSDSSGRWSNQDFDHAISQAEALNGADRLQLYQQAERIAIENVGWLPLYHETLAAVIPPWLHGVALNGNGLYFGDWSDVYILAH